MPRDDGAFSNALAHLGHGDFNLSHDGCVTEMSSDLRGQRPEDRQYTDMRPRTKRFDVGGPCNNPFWQKLISIPPPASVPPRQSSRIRVNPGDRAESGWMFTPSKSGQPSSTYSHQAAGNSISIGLLTRSGAVFLGNRARPRRRSALCAGTVRPCALNQGSYADRPDARLNALSFVHAFHPAENKTRTMMPARKGSSTVRASIHPACRVDYAVISSFNSGSIIPCSTRLRCISKHLPRSCRMCPIGASARYFLRWGRYIGCAQLSMMAFARSMGPRPRRSASPCSVARIWTECSL